MALYRRTDKIPVKIDDITITISPLSTDQKAEIMHHAAVGQTKRDFKSLFKSSVLAVKYAVKGISGMKYADGTDVTLTFEGDVLTDECVHDLFNLTITSRLTQVCSALTGGIPDEFTDQDGKKLEGVEFVKKETPEKN